MRIFRNNPRRSIILILYVLVVVGSLLLSVSWWVLIAAFAVLTLALVLIFFYDCVAMLGNFFYAQGNLEKSVRYLKFAVEHNSKSPAAHINYSVYLLRNGYAAQAESLLDKALGLNPQVIAHKHILMTKASCRWVQGDIDGAIELLEKMRKLFEYVNAPALSTLAYMYFLKGDLEQAESLSQAALEDTPSTASAWDNLGQIRYAQNDLPQAREAFEKALEYKNDLPDSHYYLGLIAQAEGDTAQAAEYFRKALDCKITALNTVTREQIQAALDGMGI